MFLCIFPPDQKLDVVIDRTEWDFGKYQCNILMVILSNRTLTLPLYWELLENNSGNSHTNDRIDLVSKCLEILTEKRISVFLGDREFIGGEWIKYLKNNKIDFCFRIPKHHNIVSYDQDMNCVIRKASKLLDQYPEGIVLNNQFVDGVLGNVYVGKGADGKLLFLFGSLPPETLPLYYKRRWTIEAFFQNLKGRGFNLKKTHLQSSEKLKKLIACVSLTYTFCVNVGLYHHRKVQKIPSKNHGRRAKSFSRKGIDIIRNLCKKPKLLDCLIRKFVKTLVLNAKKILDKNGVLTEKIVV